MADYQSDRTGANIDQVLDNADAGNIGKESLADIVDMNLARAAGFYRFTSSTLNRPAQISSGVMWTSPRGTQDGFQFAGAVLGDIVVFRRYSGNVFSDWQEIYHSNGNGVTASEAATAIKGAKDGNIGVINSIEADTQGININGMFRVNNGSPNTPIPASFNVLNMASSTSTNTNILLPWLSGIPRAFIQSQSGTYSSIEELYHTGNTEGITFQSAGAGFPSGSTSVTNIASNGVLRQSITGTTDQFMTLFFNGNGNVGGIKTNGTATSFNTSSDNRLKTPIGKPSDADIDAKFNDIYDTFTLFNWKNNPDGDAVWGFLAHDVIDKGLDFGSEGDGPRNLDIGDVYETIPAETEQRPIMETITDEDGNEIEQQATDENGNLLFETVVIKEAIEKRVTPAGVDQSKVVPYLVAKIEQLERRLAALEGA